MPGHYDNRRQRMRSQQDIAQEWTRVKRKLNAQLRPYGLAYGDDGGVFEVQPQRANKQRELRGPRNAATGKPGDNALLWVGLLAGAAFLLGSK